MFHKRDRNDVRLIRHARVRKKISGTPDMPRLCVFRSNQFIYAQLIDDTQGITLAQANSQEASLKDELAGKKKVEQSKLVGKLIAQRALDKGLPQWYLTVAAMCILAVWRPWPKARVKRASSSDKGGSEKACNAGIEQ